MKALVLTPSEAFKATVTIQAVLSCIRPETSSVTSPSYGVTQINLVFDDKATVDSVRVIFSMLRRHNIPFDAILEHRAQAGMSRSHDFLAFRPGKRFLQVTDETGQGLFKSASNDELMDRFRAAAEQVNSLAAMEPIETVAKNWPVAHAQPAGGELGLQPDLL